MGNPFEKPPGKVEQVKCPDCNGKGYVEGTKCKRCNGTGIKPFGR
jgi:DnaJ-class molecular chaperone